MKLNKFVAVLIVLPSLASSDQLEGTTGIYFQELGAFDYGNGNSGNYSQDWNAKSIGTEINTGREIVYVESAGKLAAFYGLLAVDCSAPQFSEWLAESATFGSARVPIEAIEGARALVC